MSDLTDDWQGTSCVRVKDGMVFTFTKETLERLLSASQKAGRVVVFVKQGAQS